MHWLDWKMSNFYHTWSEIALSSLCLSLSIYRTDNCTDPWSQTRHCDVSFDPLCQVKGEENRKLTCALTLATVWLLLPVWSGGGQTFASACLAPFSPCRLSCCHLKCQSLLDSAAWALNCNRFLPKKIKSQFFRVLPVCLFFAFHVSLPYYFFFLVQGEADYFN